MTIYHFKKEDMSGDIVSVETNTHGIASPGFVEATKEEVESFRDSLPEPIENDPDFRSTMEKIRSAERRFGAYWVYQRLLGNTPAEMPEPLRTRPGVPDRDPNGTAVEQAVDRFMTEYENENSL